MKINKKYLGILIFVGIVIAITAFFNPFSTFARDEAEGRIAFVDVQKVFELHPDKSTAEKELNEAAQLMQSELEEKANDLSQEKQQDLLSEYQNKLSEKEQQLIQSVLQEIEDAIKSVAEEKQVKLVLDKRNVIYGGYDMTQDVIDYINEKRENDGTENGSIEEENTDEKEETNN